MFARLLMAAALMLLALAPARAEQIILYKNAQVPLQGNPDWNWQAYSNAYTASTADAYFDLWKREGKQVDYAEVLIVATFDKPEFNAFQAVRMNVCGAINGIANLDPCNSLAWVAARGDLGVMAGEGTMACAGFAQNPSGPHPCRADVTSAIQILIDQGAPDMYFSQASYGAGIPVQIWDIELNIWWK